MCSSRRASGYSNATSGVNGPARTHPAFFKLEQIAAVAKHRAVFQPFENAFLSCLLLRIVNRKMFDFTLLEGVPSSSHATLDERRCVRALRLRRRRDARPRRTNKVRQPASGTATIPAPAA